MSSGHKTVIGFCTVILGLVLVIVGLALHWSTWVWTAAAMLFVAVAAALRRWATPTVDPLSQEFTAEPDRPTDPPERREETVTDVILPSAAEDYDFRFSATIRWWPEELPRNTTPFSPAGVAVSAVLERARAVTEKWEPHRGSLARHRLCGELAVMLPDPGGRVLAMAENVTLALAEADAVRLRKLSTVRKDETLWAHERRYERDRREYLGKDVLQDTGSAVVWWLAKNDDQIRETVDDLGLLAQLSSAANNRDVPERYAHLVPHPPRNPDAEAQAHSFPYASADGSTDGRSEDCSADPFASPFADTYAANGTGATSVNAFERLLAAMGVPADHPDAGVLARALHEGATAVAREGGSESIRDRFDPAAREAAQAGPSEDGGEAEADVPDR